MHAKVVTFQIQPGKKEEAVRLFKEYVIPAAKKQKGFNAGLLLTEPGTGKGISIGLWNSEADIRASESGGFYQGWLAKFADVFASPPSRELYEVNNLVNLSVD
jgi:heme-degrading monooxygenase HmoA